MPNRRRRKLSTTMSTVAALAVASPFAVAAFTHLNESITPAPQEREFVQAATITELPGEIFAAVQSGLSQFGVVLPNLPSSLMGPSASPALTSPGLFPAPGLASPGLTSPGLGVGDITGALTDPALTNPALTSPGLTSPLDPAAALTNPLDPAAALTAPATGLDALASPAVPGLTTPPLDVPLAGPVGLDAGLGLDPGLGTYPILGDPFMPAAPASGGLIGELSNVADQLGVTQAIDLLRGVVMPQLTDAIQNAGPPAPVPPPAPLPAG